MSKRGEAALAYAEPSHPNYTVPCWDYGDVGRYCGCTRHNVRLWVQKGLLSRVDVPGRVNPRFRPCDVVAATVVRRVPRLATAKKRARRKASA